LGHPVCVCLNKLIDDDDDEGEAVALHEDQGDQGGGAPVFETFPPNGPHLTTRYIKLQLHVGPS